MNEVQEETITLTLTPEAAVSLATLCGACNGIGRGIHIGTVYYELKAHGLRYDINGTPTAKGGIITWPEQEAETLGCQITLNDEGNYELSMPLDIACSVRTICGQACRTGSGYDKDDCRAKHIFAIWAALKTITTRDPKASAHLADLDITWPKQPNLPD